MVWDLFSVPCLGKRDHRMSEAGRFCLDCGLCVRRRSGGPDGVKNLLRMRSRGWCEARLVEDRPHVGSQAHHIVKVEWGGSWALSNLLHICRPCHDMIHRDEEKSLRNGWLAREECNPVLT